MNWQRPSSSTLLCEDHSHSEPWSVCILLSELNMDLGFMYVGELNNHLQGMHVNSSSRWMFKDSLLMNYTFLLLWYSFYLIRKCCLPEFQIFFSICQNSLQGTSQKLFIEVLGCPHQGWQWHGHLHFHPGKVLQQRYCYGIQQPRGTAVVCCNISALVIVPSSWQTPDAKQNTQVRKGCLRAVITLNLWCCRTSQSDHSITEFQIKVLLQ